MNPQGGGGVGGYHGGVGSHGMVNMAMLQSLEQMIGEGPAGQSMMMSGVQQTVGGGSSGSLTGGGGGGGGGVAAGGNVGDGRTDVGRPEIAARSGGGSGTGGAPSRYESQKRRDWNTFQQYLKNHRPPLALARCSGAHVLEFLRYLDQFGKTKVHAPGCPFFGHPQPPAPCACPLRQAWGSLDALIGRLRAAYEEHGGKPESNPFGARAVRLYLREVREMQAKARGIAYEKKKRKRPPPPNTSAPVADHSNFHPPPPPAPPAAPSSTAGDHQSLLSGTSSLLIPSFN